MTDTSYRNFLKGYDEKELETSPSDQERGVARPEIQKSCAPDAALISLTPPEKITLGRQSLFDLIKSRKSRRSFTDEELTLEELSFLLFASQGVLRTLYDNQRQPANTLRTVPSAGARHPFETYLVINRVAGIEPGLYRYLPIEHQLCAINHQPDLAAKVAEGCCGQNFIATGAVIFIWTAVPYRMEWRYIHYAGKFVAQDSGHLCQNLYLTAEAIGAGTCAIGAYFQEKMDVILGVDGKDEFTVYIAPVGKIKTLKTIELAEDKLRKYVGRYQSEANPDRHYSVLLEAGSLILQPADQNGYKLAPESETGFHLIEIDGVSLTFMADDKGVVTGFAINQAGKESLARKIE